MRERATFDRMPTERLVYVPLDDARITALAQASGLTVEEIVQAAVTEFLDEERENPLEIFYFLFA